MIKPKFRDNTVRLNTSAIEAYHGTWQSCISCDFFNEKQEICEKYGSRPPARVIAFSCEEYKDDNFIPF